MCANAALERLDPGECPICRGTGGPMPGVRGGDPSPSATQAADVADRATIEPDTHVLLHAVRLEIDAADVPIAEADRQPRRALDRSCAEIAAELDVDEPAVERVLDVVRRSGPASARAA